MSSINLYRRRCRLRIWTYYRRCLWRYDGCVIQRRQAASLAILTDVSLPDVAIEDGAIYATDPDDWIEMGPSPEWIGGELEDVSPPVIRVDRGEQYMPTVICEIAVDLDGEWESDD